MQTWDLVSSCDDSGSQLASRLEDGNFMRVIESHESEEACEAARQSWLDWYASRSVPIGEGCLAIRKRNEPIPSGVAITAQRGE